MQDICPRIWKLMYVCRVEKGRAFVVPYQGPGGKTRCVPDVIVPKKRRKITVTKSGLVFSEKKNETEPEEVVFGTIVVVCHMKEGFVRHWDTFENYKIARLEYLDEFSPEAILRAEATARNTALALAR